MNKISYFLFLLLCLSSKVYPKQIENLELYQDAVTTIRTSPGYTTLIEVPQKPHRVVIGDQDSFKVEFVGNNIAVKPLIRGIKTNLFIFAGDEKFHCTLISGAPSALQYIVRLNNKIYEAKKLNLSRKRDKILVQISEYKKYFSSRRQELTLHIKNSGKAEILLDPENFDLSFGNTKAPISSIFIEKTKVKAGESIEARLIYFSRTIEKDDALNFKLTIMEAGPVYFPFLGRDFK